MGHESQPHNAPAESNDPSVFDPEGDFSSQADLLSNEMTPAINKGLNEKIGFQIQAEQASERVDPLLEAHNSILVAKEIDRHTKGEITDDDLSEAAKDAIANGATPKSLLEAAFAKRDMHHNVTQEQESDVDFEQQLRDARTEYIELLMKRPLLKGRKQHATNLEAAQQNYNAALVNKIDGILTMDPEDLKAQYTVPMGREFGNENPTREDLGGNQLHVLVDQLAREQQYKARDIKELSNRGVKRVMNAFMGSRAIRVAVGGAILTGSMIATSKGLLPENMSSVGEISEKIFPFVTAALTSREVIAGAGDAVENAIQSKRLRSDIKKLTKSSFLTESALRTIYGGVEYQDGRIKNRTGGNTPAEDRDAFGRINQEFENLNEEAYRGGKPYRAEEVIPYVADLYLNRRDQIDEIVASADSKAAFLKLSQEVIAADSQKLTERQKASRGKKALYGALAVTSTYFAGEWLQQTRDFQTFVARPTAA